MRLFTYKKPLIEAFLTQTLSQSSKTACN